MGIFTSFDNILWLSVPKDVHSESNHQPFLQKIDYLKLRNVCHLTSTSTTIKMWNFCSRSKTSLAFHHQFIGWPNGDAYHNTLLNIHCTSEHTSTMFFYYQKPWISKGPFNIGEHRSKFVVFFVSRPTILSKMSIFNITFYRWKSRHFCCDFILYRWRGNMLL